MSGRLDIWTDSEHFWGKIMERRRSHGQAILVRTFERFFSDA